jgi:hypothetical protein
MTMNLFFLIAVYPFDYLDVSLLRRRAVRFHKFRGEMETYVNDCLIEMTWNDIRSSNPDASRKREVFVMFGIC